VYDALGVLLSGKRSVTVLDEIFKTERMQFPVGALRMRFTTNHDKNAWDAPAVTKLGMEGLKLATVLVNTIPGVPMIYSGEEVANDRKLDLFEKVEVDWSRPREVGELYAALFHLRKRNKALARGDMIRLGSNFPPEVYAFARRLGEDAVIVVLNFSNEPRLVRVDVPLRAVFGSAEPRTAADLFDGQRVALRVEAGETIVSAMEPKACRVFVVQK